MTYDDFQIEAFEAGKGLWHAKIRRADFGPVVIDGLSFAQIEVGFAWPSGEAAIAHAKTRIDHLNRRSVITEPKRKTAHV